MPGGVIRNRPNDIGALVGGRGGLESLGATGGLGPARTLDSFIGPRVESLIAKIQAAMGNGLPPEIGMQLLQSAAGGVQQRFDAYRDRRQDQRAELRQQAQLDDLMQGLPPEAMQASQLSQLGVPAEMISDIFAGGAGGGGLILTPEDIQNIAADAMNFASGQYEGAIGPLSLHDARMRIMTVLRSQGYPDGELAKAFDTIGRAYQAVGGRIGQAPLTYAERPTTQPTPTPRPQQSNAGGGGIAGTLDDLFGGLRPVTGWPWQ